MPAGRADRLRPWLWALLIVIAIGSAVGIGLVEARQDPTLEIPLDGEGAPVTQPDTSLPIPLPEPS